MASPGHPRYAIARHRPANNVGSTPARAALPRMKIVIRRLPPGLTDQEFYESLGEQWRLGGERVDWASFKPGKISRDPAKPSRPARVYLHLTKQDYLGVLSDKVRETQFSDAKATGSDPALLGPPIVEFAAYGRVPNPKPRKDARQGTIDQDPEFIDFLESLTNPTAKPAPTEGGSDTETKKEAVTVTPLIQFLRDKKANKGKEASIATKATKHNRNDSKESKSSQGPEKKTPVKSGSTTSPQLEKRSVAAIKVEKAARDAVKLLNKQVHGGSKAPSSSPASSPAPKAEPSQSSVPAPTPERKRERGTMNAAARIQRDLGLSGSPGGRRRRDMAAANPPSPTITNVAKPPVTAQPSGNTASNTASPLSNVTPTPPTQANTSKSVSSATIQPPTGPAASRSTHKPPNVNPPRPQQSSVPASPKPPSIASTSTQAFLKHANPSQGITEPLLEQAFATYGTITKVEIDKKKGFAYIDFADPEGLQMAIAGSPVKVAQGQVVVLERKTGPTLQARNVRGGPAMIPNRGGGAPMGPRGGRGGAMRGRGGATRGGVPGQVAKPVVAPSTTTNTVSSSTTAPPLPTTAPATVVESPGTQPTVPNVGTGPAGAPSDPPSPPH
ncbi:hypothetical protein MMC11_003950 [Xylographa trunciseda]|nr:hypothetical protein [Xylographa trunciseda]